MILNEPDIIETEKPPHIVEFFDASGVFFNQRFSDDKRIRKEIYSRIMGARKLLPDGLTYVIYEAYRPRAKQITMWDDMFKRISSKNPSSSEEELVYLCEKLIANPYRIGSGHQFGCAVDITLCTLSGEELDMGTQVQEFSDLTTTASKIISKEQRQNRNILQASLEKTGLINYPEEWWHFSYGDRLWAILTKEDKTKFGLLDF